MKVYVASSWRNPTQPDVVRALRAAGHEVYDFREPKPGNHGFSWHEVDPTIPRGPADIVLDAEQIVTMLEHPVSEAGFALDMGALEWCEACVLVLPCGRSAHLEAGWAAGAGKLTVGLLAEGEPDLMWKMLDHLVTDMDGVLYALPTPEEACSLCGESFPVPVELHHDDAACLRTREATPPRRRTGSKLQWQKNDYATLPDGRSVALFSEQIRGEPRHYSARVNSGEPTSPRWSSLGEGGTRRQAQADAQRYANALPKEPA